MRKIIAVIVAPVALSVLLSLPSCNSTCVDEVLLQAIKMDLQVNAANLGVAISGPFNSTDTIRSSTSQFYSYPVHRRFGQRAVTRPGWSFFATAYAQDDCPEQIDYISRMDPTRTIFSLDVDYDAAAVGLGIIPAGTDLMNIPEIESAYLQEFTDNPFLNGGAPTPLTIDRDFFQPISDQWVLFRFSFEEIDGTIFPDSAYAFIDITF